MPVEELEHRLGAALAAAMQFAAEFPADRLQDRLPRRDRTYLGLANHVVEIAAVFLRASAGAPFDVDASAAIPLTELGVEDLRLRAEDIGRALGRDGRTRQSHGSDLLRPATPPPRAGTVRLAHDAARPPVGDAAHPHRYRAETTDPDATCMEVRPRRWGNCRHFPARRRSGTLPRLKAPCMEARPRRRGNCRHFPARRRSGTLPRLKAPSRSAPPDGGLGLIIVTGLPAGPCGWSGELALISPTRFSLPLCAVSAP